MKELAPALAIVLGLLVLPTAWRALPVLAALIRPAWVRVRFEDPLSIEAALSGPQATQALVHALREAGFRILGIEAEKLPLWGESLRAIALVSSDAGAYALIGLNRDGSPSGLSLHTPLSDGRLVYTSSASDELVPARAGDRVQQMPEAGPAEVLAAHRQGLREMLEGGAVAQVEHTPEARIKAASDLIRRRLHTNAGLLIVRQGVLTFVLALGLLALVVAWWQWN